METALDLDAISAACPGCHILVVEGSSEYPDDLGVAVNTAVALGAKFVSNSYGQSDTGQGALGLDQYYDHPGVAVTVASGDEGGSLNWPASNPDVTAVGGTTLTRDNSARGWHEAAWGGIAQGAGGGSGCSPTEPKPAFQDGVTADCNNRAVADISAVAGTGLAVYDTFGNSGWASLGGTSLASPLVASMYALAGTPQPQTYPVNYPYQAHSGLNDIVDGVNSGCGNVLCQAGPG
jgi:subtilase family serine protease